MKTVKIISSENVRAKNLANLINNIQASNIVIEYKDRGESEGEEARKETGRQREQVIRKTIRKDHRESQEIGGKKEKRKQKYL